MKECPRCHSMTLEDEQELNALSRRDNKTYICTSCGEVEALIDAGIKMPGKYEREFVAKVCKQGAG